MWSPKSPDQCPLCRAQVGNKELHIRAACPELAVYRYGDWPRHLMTKTQLAQAGYNVGLNLPLPAAKVWRPKSRYGWLLLYDRRQAIKRDRETTHDS